METNNLLIGNAQRIKEILLIRSQRILFLPD